MPGHSRNQWPPEPTKSDSLPPQRFEAGIGNIADAVGLGAAIGYLDRVGIVNVSRHEHMPLTYATAAPGRIPGLHMIGTAKEKAGVLSFAMDGFRTEEIGDYGSSWELLSDSNYRCDAIRRCRVSRSAPQISS